MTDTLCQVCFNEKRKPRFKTPSICLCQWCITELTTSVESPAEIIYSVKEHIRAKIKTPLLAELERLKVTNREPPILQAIELQQAAQSAKQQIIKNEGLGTYLYRQLFDASARDIEISTLTKQLQSVVSINHTKNLKAYVLQMIDLDKNIDVVRNKLAEMEDAVDASFQSFMTIRLVPKATKLKTTRILRAYNFGLIELNKICTKRLEGSEAEVLAKHVRRRDRYLCVICNRFPRGSELHVHHIIPLSFFGTNNEPNLATLCYSCHNRQHPNFAIQRMRSNQTKN
jgi:hypothetical protein